MRTKEEELADTITNGLNSMMFDEKEFVKAMSNEHRTLQQKFTRLALNWIEHLAELDPKRTDARNEASRKTSKHLIDCFKACANEDMKGFKPSDFLPHI
jgi:predicted YcjX-like family ATPase